MQWEEPQMTDLVVVTGGAGVLGSAILAEFLDGGRTVVAIDARPRADGADGHPKLHRLTADLTDRSAVRAVWEQIDGLGSAAGLVNVTGGFAPGSLAETDEQTLTKMIGINVTTTLWSCQAAAPRLEQRGGGAIVNIGARNAVEGGGPVAYAIAKSSVVRLTQVLAQELKEQRIRVNVLLPSLIDTPANRANLSAESMRRAVPPASIAKVVAFLCSDDAWPVSGAVIPVYGQH
jgi:NAD(P)-dependent dehydrogenase (short-subunit alcohol dehydrogenase family)